MPVKSKCAQIEQIRFNHRFLRKYFNFSKKIAQNLKQDARLRSNMGMENNKFSKELNELINPCFDPVFKSIFTSVLSTTDCEIIAADLGCDLKRQNVAIMGLWRGFGVKKRAQRCGKDAARCCGQNTRYPGVKERPTGPRLGHPSKRFEGGRCHNK